MYSYVTARRPDAAVSNWVSRLPEPLPFDAPMAFRPRLMKPAPSDENRPKSLLLRLMKLLEPLLVRKPVLAPEVPAKSILPSKALSANVSLKMGLATTSTELSGRYKVSSDDRLKVTSDALTSRLSALPVPCTWPTNENVIDFRKPRLLSNLVRLSVSLQLVPLKARSTLKVWVYTSSCGAARTACGALKPSTAAVARA